MNTTIDLVKCPYCREEFIFSDSDLVCEKCKSLLDIDLAIMDIEKALSVLEKYFPGEIPRLPILNKLVDRLDDLIRKG